MRPQKPQILHNEEQRNHGDLGRNHHSGQEQNKNHIMSMEFQFCERIPGHRSRQKLHQQYDRRYFFYIRHKKYSISSSYRNSLQEQAPGDTASDSFDKNLDH